MKTCTSCGVEKERSGFARRARAKDGLQAWCRMCHAARFASLGPEAKTQRNARTAHIRRRNYAARRAFMDALKSQPCTDCGVSYPPCVMDFDHLPGTVKSFNLAQWSRGTSGISERAKREALNEIAKCELVCANCHRLRTHARR